MTSMKNRTTKSKPQSTPVPLTIPPRDYQPSKAEKEAEITMPKTSLKTVASAVFRPVTVKVKAVEKVGTMKNR